MKFKRMQKYIIAFAIIVLLILFIILDRKFKWFGYKDDVIKIDGNCVRIECTHIDKTDAILENEDDINECIEILSKMKLRKKDFIDVLLDSRTYNKYYGPTPKYITMILENGEEVTVSFYLNGYYDISEIYYNGNAYMVKGETPDFIPDLFFGNN